MKIQTIIFILLLISTISSVEYAVEIKRTPSEFTLIFYELKKFIKSDGISYNPKVFKILDEVKAKMDICTFGYTGIKPIFLKVSYLYDRKNNIETFEFENKERAMDTLSIKEMFEGDIFHTFAEEKKDFYEVNFAIAHEEEYFFFLDFVKTNNKVKIIFYPLKKVEGEPLFIITDVTDEIKKIEELSKKINAIEAGQDAFFFRLTLRRNIHSLILRLISNFTDQYLLKKVLSIY